MFIIDGIAYAGEQIKPIQVKSVRPLANYKLLITFSDGVVKTFDFAPLLNYPAFVPLKDKANFDCVYIEYGVVTWDGGIDISSEKLYLDGVKLDNEAV